MVLRQAWICLLSVSFYAFFRLLRELKVEAAVDKQGQDSGKKNKKSKEIKRRFISNEHCPNGSVCLTIKQYG